MHKHVSHTNTHIELPILEKILDGERPAAKGTQLSLSGPRFPHLSNGDNSPHPVDLWGCGEVGSRVRLGRRTELVSQKVLARQPARTRGGVLGQGLQTQWGLPAPTGAFFLSESRPSPPPTPEGDGREEGLQPKDASRVGKG